MIDGWSTERVLALAPDAGSQAAGRKLATPAPWSATGHDDSAVWGACKGSGKQPYEVEVDLGEPAFRCSCPSRKFPCKHALGLLLLAAEQPQAVPAGAAPARVTEWLATRGEREERAAQRTAKRSSTPADPEAAAKRAARRAERTTAGMEELRRWLEDLVRQGLAASQQQTYGYWDRVAARMVDAQAPGAASRVRTLSHLPSMPDPSWARRMLEELGLLYLLVEAYGRLDELPEAVRADVTSQLGWPVAQEEVLRGPRTRGRWTVTGRVVEERESLTTQRTWLAGDDGTPALVLSFAPPGGMLDTSLVPGTVVDAELAFYPSAAPLRALVAERHGEEPAREAVGAASIDEAFGRRAAALAANPWLDRWPMALREVGIVRIEEHRFEARTGDRAVPLRISDHTGWRLVAESGGRPVGLYGEWWRSQLRPFAVHAEGRTVAL